LDLILVEGFRHEFFDKIELHRPSLGKPLIFPHDEAIIAVATDEKLPASIALPVLNLNDPDEICHFILHHVFNR
jgi:molybdopterin-guanine dinucleotide biosynthesis protein B